MLLPCADGAREHKSATVSTAITGMPRWDETVGQYWDLGDCDEDGILVFLFVW